MKHSTKLKNNKREVQQNDDVDEDVTMERIEIPGDIVQTLTVPRGPVSTIHTQMDYLHSEMVRSKKHFHHSICYIILKKNWNICHRKK